MAGGGDPIRQWTIDSGQLRVGDSASAVVHCQLSPVNPAISQQTISEMESGAADTGIETLARYAAQALGRRLRLAKL